MICDYNRYIDEKTLANHGRRKKFAGGVPTIAHKNARSALTRGVWGHVPPEIFWFSGLMRSFLVHKLIRSVYYN